MPYTPAQSQGSDHINPLK